MNATPGSMEPRRILPGVRMGTARVPSSKSEVHRLLIAAALSARPVTIETNGLSEDIFATAWCLSALGADIEIRETEEGETIRVTPAGKTAGASPVLLPCRESGSTLRFLIPLAGALHSSAVFHREGRLPERPVRDYLDVLSAHGMSFREDGADLEVSGQLLSGEYDVRGNVSSQYVTGLLFALPVLSGESVVSVLKPVESKEYIRMTVQVLESAGIRLFTEDLPDRIRFRIPGGQCYALPERVKAGGDWSGAAFFLALGALSEEGVTVTGLSENSTQGDRKILDILAAFGARIEQTEAGIHVLRGMLRGTVFDAAEVPDLVPPVSVVAALSEGETRICHAERLRFKESDRLRETANLLRALGGKAEETADGLRIIGVPFFTGGRVSSAGDHRIAMSAAIAAAGSKEPVLIENPEVVGKSFPKFYEELDALSRKEQK